MSRQSSDIIKPKGSPWSSRTKLWLSRSLSTLFGSSLTLESDGKTVVDDSEEIRFICNPFLGLPDSITAHVFAYCKCNSTISKPAECILAGVCAHWRYLALRCPELWTTITASALVTQQDEFIIAYLQRSQSQKVDLYLDLAYASPQGILLSLIRRNAHRWRSLHFRCSSVESQRLLISSRDFSSAKFPALEHLSVICLEPFDEAALEHLHDSDRPNTELLVDPVYATHLHSISIQTLGLMLFKPPFHSITTLHLEQNTSGDMKPFHLSFFPRLVHLSLYGDFQFKLIELELLHLLSLRSSDNRHLGGLLGSLYAPCLEFLVLRNVRDQHMQGYGIPSDPEDCRFPALRHIILSNVRLSRSRLRVLFLDLMAATQLDFVNCEAEELLGILSDEGLGGEPKQCSLPFLKTLSVHQFASGSDPTALLSRFLNARSPRPLMRLRLHHRVLLSKQFWAIDKATEIIRWQEIPHWPPGRNYSDLNDPFTTLSSRVMIDQLQIATDRESTGSTAERKTKWYSLKQLFHSEEWL